MYEKYPSHLNIILYIVKMKHRISHFYNALLEHHLLHQAWCEV